MATSFKKKILLLENSMFFCQNVDFWGAHSHTPLRFRHRFPNLRHASVLVLPDHDATRHPSAKDVLLTKLVGIFETPRTATDQAR